MDGRGVTRRSVLAVLAAAAGCGGRRPTATPSLAPDGPVEPAGGITATDLTEDVLTVRTVRYPQSTDPGWAAVKLALQPDASGAIEIGERTVRRHPPLQNGLAYAGYRPSLVVVETSRDAGRAALRELDALRPDDQPRRFRFEECAFEIGVTSA